MHRQKSILSFLKKPDDNIAVDTPSHQNATHPVVDQVRGTDTPPEKVPRQIFSAKVGDICRGPSLFENIMHKFTKPTTSTRNNEKDGFDTVHSNVPVSPSTQIGASGFSRTKKFLNPETKTVDQEAKGPPLCVESDADICGPETPGMKPLVPRLKRIQEDTSNSVVKSDCSLRNSSKRVKFLDEAEIKDKNREVLCEVTSKFEWLHTSKIKDANGRRPNSPSYDKRTLYIPPDALRNMSASQKQYWTLKSQYMDVLMFFKVGKFYELYELDAEIGHKELDWKITLSGVGKCRQVGISENGIDDAVQKLIAHGYKVGMIEQVETSEQAKSRGASSIIQRKLVQVVTPSTNLDGNIGPDAVHLLSIIEDNCGLDDGSTAYGFAFVDCAALKFWVGSFNDDSSYSALGTLLMQVSPKEILYESHGLSREAQKAVKKYSSTGSSICQITPVQTSTTFADQFEVRNLIQSKGYFKGFCNNLDYAFDGIMHCDLSFRALGGLITHLSRLMLDDAIRNGDIIPYQLYRGCLRMDGQTLTNLEIFNNTADGSSSGTLYNYLDKCITPSGKRLLRHWICHPLKDVQEISRRLNVVEEMMAQSDASSLLQHLRKLPDLERLLGRIKSTVKSSALLMLPLIRSKILKQRVKEFGSLVKGLRVGLDLLKLLHTGRHAISSLNTFVKLPELGGDDGIDKFLSQIEAAIDSDFPDYQDHNPNDSNPEILSILMELFCEKCNEWSEVIHAISCIDVLRSFAVISKFSPGVTCRPIILPLSEPISVSDQCRGPTLKLKGLWHPFALGAHGGLPVPNDVHLGEDAYSYHPCTLLLTGPNMGGKSTLLRATCLAIILAQLGCYVPCESCVLSLVDIIFTRLGASDRIMTGESTFLIECTETASVLQNATQNSLVLLDELGRGTSTFDGYAIAYAVFRHLIEKVNCRLLFATHYHPLTKEFALHPRVILQHMAFTFKSKSETSAQGDKELVFLYKLTNGACPESYGMQVALNAGVPQPVVEAASRAGQVMKRMVGESFKLSECRSEFSTLHEEWLKTLLAVSATKENILDDNDAFDTLFCLWHEMKCSSKI
ncbi:DNA mismatch repair protein MSH7 [Heracleum sosnowskyi]|uniref:DNA mismatch repair protein MSH7 n=1 Tax=Heracleum sosnowskyi TaxID=360622 RepID=A0AAD8J396_9APIA|nr:DNA mismatch repair protein MSH7 [Heracleum sosnowskyi]